MDFKIIHVKHSQLKITPKGTWNNLSLFQWFAAYNTAPRVHLRCRGGVATVTEISRPFLFIPLVISSLNTKEVGQEENELLSHLSESGKKINYWYM